MAEGFNLHLEVEHAVVVCLDKECHSASVYLETYTQNFLSWSKVLEKWR